MIICFSGGGTLGHIYPALSLIKTLKEKKDHKVIFISTIKDKKYECLKSNEDINRIYYIDAIGFKKRIIDNFKVSIKALKAYYQIKTILKKEKVDIIVGMGGYISGITILAGNHLKIKTVIHEQNSVLGLANKLVIRKVDLVLLSFPLSINKKIKSKTFIVGNPRMNDASIRKPSRFKSSYNLLITSGSLGSSYINEIAIDFLKSEYAKKYSTTLITGTKYYDKVKNSLPKNSYYEIIPFTNNLLEHLDKAGLVISRAGSSTIFEIIGSNTISLLIPSPNVTRNHQFYNALYFQEKGMIEMIEEDEIKKEGINVLINCLKSMEIKYIEYLDNILTYKETINNEKIINMILSLKNPLIKEGNE